MSKLFVALTLGIFAASIAESALAAAPYKTVTDGKTRLHFDGTPLTSIPITTALPPSAKSGKANACGWVLFRTTPTAEVVAFDLISGFGSTQLEGLSSTPTGTPTCINGVDSNPGAISFRDENYIYLRGLPNTTWSAIVYRRRTRQVRLNGCGYGQIIATPSILSSSVRVGSQWYSFSSLATKTYPNRCYKVGGNWVKYQAS